MPADLVVKKGNIEFKQPLDYMGIPFRCYRCHVYGHLANECSLPFNQKPISVKNIWRVKKSETNLIAKEGKLHDECLKDVNLSPFLDDKDLGSLSSLSNLKPLCINNLVEDLGGLNIDNYFGFFF